MSPRQDSLCRSIIAAMFTFALLLAGLACDQSRTAPAEPLSAHPELAAAAAAAWSQVAALFPGREWRHDVSIRYGTATLCQDWGCYQVSHATARSIEIRPETSPGYFPTVIYHELLHAFLLQHGIQPAGVDNAHPTQVQGIPLNWYPS